MKLFKAAFLLFALLGGHPAATQTTNQQPELRNETQVRLPEPPRSDDTPQPVQPAEPHFRQPEASQTAGRHFPEQRPQPQRPRPLGIAYCDADHLYDTVPSPFYDDSDYTPQGRLHWNTERYRRKIARNR